MLNFGTLAEVSMFNASLQCMERSILEVLVDKLMQQSLLMDYLVRKL